MKSEAEVCTIIKNSFIAQGHYLYKIPDPSSTFSATIKRDFDLVGRYEQRPIYMEVKYLNELRSFNLKSLEEHQIKALMEYTKIPSALCLVGLGVNVSRCYKIIYFWNINDILIRIKEERNFLKKELESIPHYTITNKLINEKLIF